MNSYEEEQWGTTDIKTIKFKYSWTINNFSFNRKKIGQFIESPVFSMPGLDVFKWFLSLYPKGEKDEYKDYLSVFLNLKPVANPISIRTKITFSILNRQKKEHHAYVIDDIFKEPIGYGVGKFVGINILYALMDDFVPDDKLTIVCRVTAGLEKVENSSKGTIQFEEERSEFTLSSELESLLTSKHMADVTLLADGKELKAHKTILAARSTVFLAMLQTDMQEKQNSRIEFADVSIDVLNEMLHYLYTGKVKNIKDYAYDLVKLADKYDINGLKLVCEKVFHRELCINNAIKLFILADRYNCNAVKPLVLKFMIANAKDIIKTADFNNFEKDLPILIKEIMQAIT